MYLSVKSAVAADGRAGERVRSDAAMTKVSKRASVSTHSATFSELRRVLAKARQRLSDSLAATL